MLRVAVEETGKALGVGRAASSGSASPARRCRSAPSGTAEGLPPIGADAPNLAGSNLAMREGRTVAIEDVEEEPRLEDPSLGGVRKRCSELGTRAVLATPILVFDRMIGVLAFHRASRPWDAGEIALAEAVAREVGLAIHTAALLEENARSASTSRRPC